MRLSSVAFTLIVALVGCGRQSDPVSTTSTASPDPELQTKFDLLTKENAALKMRIAAFERVASKPASKPAEPERLVDFADVASAADPQTMIGATLDVNADASYAIINKEKVLSENHIGYAMPVNTLPPGESDGVAFPGAKCLYFPTVIIGLSDKSYASWANNRRTRINGKIVAIKTSPIIDFYGGKRSDMTIYIH